MSHYAAALHVAKAIDQIPHRPLHNSSRGKRQEPKSRADHLAPARIASRPTLNTYWNSNPSCCHIGKAILKISEIKV
jgi:hypothetical protein